MISIHTEIVKVHEADGKWRPKIFKDIYPKVISRIEDYYDPFFEKK